MKPRFEIGQSVFCCLGNHKNIPAVVQGRMNLMGSRTLYKVHVGPEYGEIQFVQESQLKPVPPNNKPIIRVTLWAIICLLLLSFGFTHDLHGTQLVIWVSACMASVFGGLYYLINGETQ